MKCFLSSFLTSQKIKLIISVVLEMRTIYKNKVRNKLAFVIYSFCELLKFLNFIYKDYLKILI